MHENLKPTVQKTEKKQKKAQQQPWKQLRTTKQQRKEKSKSEEAIGTYCNHLHLCSLLQKHNGPSR